MKYEPCRKGVNEHTGFGNFPGNKDGLKLNVIHSFCFVLMTGDNLSLNITKNTETVLEVSKMTNPEINLKRNLVSTSHRRMQNKVMRQAIKLSKMWNYSHIH